MVLASEQRCIQGAAHQGVALGHGDPRGDFSDPMNTIKDEKTAAEVLAALQTDGSFQRLARERPVDVRAGQGWARVHTLPPAVREAVAALKDGETAGPVREGDDFLILRLEERRPARTKTLAEARPEIERRLLPAKQQEFLQAWLAEQEKESKIEVFR